MQKYAKVSKSMQKYAKVCKSMQKCAKVCKSMHSKQKYAKYADICKSIQNQLLQKNCFDYKLCDEMHVFCGQMNE